ncbi:thioester domain-containing protein [Clostridium sp. D53t1_180928_C8]|uniref:thioester domain-containing protein n=1 Tax=Clostridium sp. D53t1_180928_C8 TaxID=2787101 RepID=UPI0018AA7BFC|nr:thioester domain-containing protein [Clostridium sp. D53t1_180928_C8]
MKKHRNNIFIILFTLILLITNLSANVMALPTEKLSIPNHVTITVGDEIINKISYENFILEVKRIETGVGPGYCLEVEKTYPSGQRFEFAGKPAREVVGMMAAGYPNKSAAEIGVSTDNNAYFATQIAIWCVTEGYSPNKFRAKDKELLQAIKNIYEQGMQYTGNELDHTAMEYYYSDSVQRIVVYINKSDEGTGGGEGITPEVPEQPDIPTWPEIPDDEDTTDKSENVVVPGLG